MTKRGKVLRDPLAGPGLLIVEGQQYRFCLEGIWKSEVPPKPGLPVDVEFDSQCEISGITAVPQIQLTKEQEQADARKAQEQSAALARQMVAKVGMPDLAAAGLLVLAWSSLTALSVQLPLIGRLEFTFWQLLGHLNSKDFVQTWSRYRDPGAGIYGFLAAVVIAGPFIHHFLKDRRALLAGSLPLAFLIFVGISTRASILSSFLPGVDGPYANIQMEARAQLLRAMSLGSGAYLALGASLYFAIKSTRQFLATKSDVKQPLASAHQAAA